MAEIDAGLASASSLGDQLDVVFDKMVLAGFDLVRDTPNAQDIVDGFNTAGQAELDASAERFRLVIERLLSPHKKALARAGLNPSDLSDFVQRSAKTANSGARSRDQVELRLQTLRQLCLAACGG